MTLRLTIGEVRHSIQRQFGGELPPEWLIRTIVDKLDSDGRIEVQRVGQYRTVEFESVAVIADELRIARQPKSGVA